MGLGREIARTSRRLVFLNRRLVKPAPGLARITPGLVKTNPGLVITTPGLVKSKPGLVKAFGQGSHHRTIIAPNKLCKSTTLFLQGTSNVRTFAASKDNSTFIYKNTLSYPHLP